MEVGVTFESLFLSKIVIKVNENINHQNYNNNQSEQDKTSKYKNSFILMLSSYDIQHYKRKE